MATATKKYQKILIAVDQPDESKTLIAQVKAVATEFAALTLIHVVEPLESTYFGATHEAPVIFNAQDIQSQVVAIKKEQIEQLKLAEDIPSAETLVDIGKPARRILEYAKQHGCDLIVIGTHSRRGFARLLGSTAAKVLNDAPCDILTIQMNESSVIKV